VVTSRKQSEGLVKELTRRLILTLTLLILAIGVAIAGCVGVLLIPRGEIERTNQFIFTTIFVVVVMAILAVILIWRSFEFFSRNLTNRIAAIGNAVDELEEGNLSVKLKDNSLDELGRLANNFNNMVEALAVQQRNLRERDILESVLELNATLTSSLELDSLLDQFMTRLLDQLDIQVGAVYLYDSADKTLKLRASQGFNPNILAPSIGLNEGIVGRVARNRLPLALSSARSEIDPAFGIQTILGEALPATLYHVPIVQHKELLGILIVGTMQPMRENVRNVLNVIVANLSSAVRNAQSFSFSQAQARELEETNAALSQQRDELKGLNAALEEASRVRTQFLSTISHELRTPLTAIIGFSQLALNSEANGRQPGRQRTNLERILRNGQHLLAMINNMLDIAKIEMGRLELNPGEIELEKFIGGVVEENSALAAGKKIALRFEPEDDLGTFETDPQKLRQIIVNLVANAIKFTDEGAVVVRVRRAGVEPGIENERLVLAVSDTGIGIPPEKQAHIFEEFYQVDGSATRKYGGTGLGLAIVRQLVGLLGGTIEVKSQVGAGTTFTVMLPVRAFSSPSANDEYEQLVYKPNFEAETASFGSVLQERTVLVIDDDIDSLHLLENGLESSRYKPVLLQNPALAVPKAEELRPYAITLDILMPEINGWQVLQRLKTNPITANIPVIVVSVTGESSGANLLGASGFLHKPVNQEVLLAMLDGLEHPNQQIIFAATDSNVVGINSKSESEFAPNGHSENGSNEYTPNGNGTLHAANDHSNGHSQNGHAPNEAAHILVVDDEQDIRDMMQEALNDAELPVRTASNGIEALRMIDQNVPDVILLDLMMPYLDGFEVLKRLNESDETANIPVIILTARSLTETEIKRLKEAGAKRILQKGNLALSRLMDEIRNLKSRAA
jgi:two-component system, chemotaxis family, sensor kinase CheA